MFKNLRRYRRIVARIIVGVTISTWIIVFMMGSTISSAPFRNLLNIGEVKTVNDEHLAASFVTLSSTPAFNPFRASQAVDELYSWRALGAWALVLATYTPTNVALLCCLAACAGSASRQMKIGVAQRSSPLKNRARGAGQGPPVMPAHPANPQAGGGAPQARATDRGGKSIFVPYAAALARGFCMYLVVLSGVIVLTGKPFAALSPEDYIRMAGTTSLLGFIAGYNPILFARFVEKLGLGEQRLAAEG